MTKPGFHQQFIISSRNGRHRKPSEFDQLAADRKRRIEEINDKRDLSKQIADIWE